jgi:large subunit ribosomal protein L28
MAMATKCEVCGKGTTFGRNIRYQHSGKWERRAPRTNRIFKANVHIQNATIGGETRRFHICTRCLRTANKIASR